jgi:serine protease Do
VGFAIPVNLVERVMEDLMDQGYVSRGWMGVMVQELSGDLAAEFDGPQGSVVVSEVVPESPAEEAGFEVGDVITTVGSETVTSASAFRNAVAGHDPGEEVDFTVLRDGREIAISTVLDQLPGDAAAAKVTGDAEEDISELGWTLRDLDPRTADQLGYDGAGGAVVTSLEPSGLAARSGLSQADVIVEVDHSPVSGVDALRRLIAASGSEALLLVWREGHTIYLVLRSE